MYRLIIILFLNFVLGTCLRAQENRKPVVLQKPIKLVTAPPIFLDSLKFRENLKKSDLLKDIFRNLEKDTVSLVFQYSFSLDKSGNLKLNVPDERQSLNNINRFVEKNLAGSKWKAGYKLNCKSCKIGYKGMVDIIFDTEDQEITCELNVFFSNTFRVFSYIINMK